MPVLTATDVSRICRGRLIGDGSRSVSSVVADSREATRNAAFVAVRGGHDFIDAAFASGAAFVVVEREESLPSNPASAVVVDNTVQALSDLAMHIRSQLAVRCVGITGSTGKTLTKDLVAAAVGVRYRVHSAPRSYNTDVTVPTVVIGCPDDAEVLVTELGARRAGEIAELCAFVQPHIGVITGIGSTHLEMFGSRRVIAQTKSELLSALPPDGLGVVPSDDDFLDVFSETTSARLRTIGAGGAIQYHAVGIDGGGRTHGVVTVDGEELPVRLAVPNRALMRNAAMALAVAIELGIDPREASAALANAALSSARMQILDIGDWTVANDAYNANPTSTAAALRSVRELAGDREAWAILGPMAELGSRSADSHRRIGRLARSLGFRGVITVGDVEAAAIAGAAGDIAHRVVSMDEAAAAAIDLIAPGSVVLIKASRVAGLDLLPDELTRRLQSIQREA